MAQPFQELLFQFCASVVEPRLDGFFAEVEFDSDVLHGRPIEILLFKDAAIFGFEPLHLFRKRDFKFIVLYGRRRRRVEFPKAFQETEVALRFAAVIDGGGAGEERKPSPQDVFVVENANVFGDFDHRLLEEIPGEFLIAARDHDQICEEAREIEAEEFAVSIFIAAAHGAGELRGRARDASIGRAIWHPEID